MIGDTFEISILFSSFGDFRGGSVFSFLLMLEEGVRETMPNPELPSCRWDTVGLVSRSWPSKSLLLGTIEVRVEVINVFARIRFGGGPLGVAGANLSAFGPVGTLPGSVRGDVDNAPARGPVGIVLEGFGETALPYPPIGAPIGGDRPKG